MVVPVKVDVTGVLVVGTVEMDVNVAVIDVEGVTGTTEADAN